MKSTTIFILTVAPASIIMMFLLITSSLNLVAEATTTEELTKYRVFDSDDFNQQILRHFFDDEYDSDDHKKGRVFYSHSTRVYGTQEERVPKELIDQTFNDFGIISPKFFKGNDKKMMSEMARF
jgi:hypothetical protein